MTTRTAGNLLGRTYRTLKGQLTVQVVGYIPAQVQLWVSPNGPRENVGPGSKQALAQDFFEECLNEGALIDQSPPAIGNRTRVSSLAAQLQAILDAHGQHDREALDRADRRRRQAEQDMDKETDTCRKHRLRRPLIVGGRIAGAFLAPSHTMLRAAASRKSPASSGTARGQRSIPGSKPARRKKPSTSTSRRRG